MKIFKTIFKKALLCTLIFSLEFATSQTNNDVQQKFNAGLKQGSDFMSGIFDNATTLVLSVSGIVALASLGYIFYGFATGERDMSKKIIAWAGGSAFIFIAVGLIKVLFF